MIGYLKNNNFVISKKTTVLDDNDIYIAIDGYVDDKNYLKHIKNYYLKDNNFMDKIKDFIAVYIYDKRKNKLLIITDRMGTKHVYYHITKDTIYFGNDLTELINTYKLEKTINIDSLSMYFRYHYIPAPQTCYKDIFKLRNGYYLTYEKNSLNEFCYWNLIEKYNEASKKLIWDYKKVSSELEKKIEKFIIKEIKYNKKQGLYLSAGIDSSLVAALLTKNSSKKINTFTIGFENNNFNEASNSKRIANYLKTNYKELYINDEECIKIIKKIPDYYPEPFGDASCAATIVLNEFAHKNNISLAFTGDGSDQIFCGLTIYDTLFKIQKSRYFLNPLNLSIIKNNKTRKLFYIFSKISKDYKSQIDISYEEFRLKDLFKDTGIKRFNQEKEINTNNIQEKRMILDLNTFMVGKVCQKMSMAAKKNNIEIRSPFLSKDIIEYSFKIPHKYKYYKKTKKYILKQILFKHIPKDFFSNKKHGFSIPTEKWLKTYLNADLKKLSTKSFLEKQNIFNYEKIQELISDIDNNANFVWDYYMFQLWYKKNIDN